MAEPYGPPAAAQAPAPAEPVGAGAGQKAGLAQTMQEQFSFEKAFGGVRGVLESVVPVTVFSVVYGVTREVTPSAVAAVVPAVGLALWRLVAREPVTQAIGGLLGVGLGAFIAVRTGQAQTFFLPSIIKNAAWAAGFLVSILVRWPAIGLLLGFMLGEGSHWRTVPARMRAYVLATWLWFGLFAVRLAVQVPLYLADKPATLGVVNIALGVPLFALVLWGTWFLVHKVPAARPEGAEPLLHLPHLHHVHPQDGDAARDDEPSSPVVERPVPET
ncbi:DUF3159 domain-containing protein [Kineosporia sp. A_224]|uniref:DUF3159 domain-containing protein n=1 Tax=Kineosporia sp. A_224 TaxID=1962180 RepID=UPI000B4B92D7|nr:DUF3159 domain-containing protein [Kineosporia sp. A_224]